MPPMFGRRRFLQTALATTLGLSGCLEAPSTTEKRTTTSVELPDEIALESLATGLQFPLDVVFTPDADRRYIAERRGVVYVHESGGLQDEPLLDIRDSVEAQGEKGFLGIELHPEFAENRRFFVRYSAPRRSGTPEDYDHTFVLSELEATADGRQAKPASERTILEIPQPQANHNAGDLAFGPDGYLYVAVGDGGRGRDQGKGHAPDWYDENGGGNGQDVTENLLGSILRIDVDDQSGDEPYGVPDDNPLVGEPGLDEQYAWGFRNPWQMSFDGDDLFVGDAGERLYEEVNLVEKGGNYGWNVREGTTCFNGDNPDEPLDTCPSRTPADVRGGEPLIDPIIEYSNSEHPMAVICGHVYRGSTFPSLDGVFVFGDLTPQGRLFAATRPSGDEMWPMHELDLIGGDADELQLLLSFGRDSDGELYVLGMKEEEDGGFYRLVPAE